jgi:hypothetical protein
MTTPNYLLATQPNAAAFTAPIFPGYLPAVQGTAAQVSDQVRAHNENLRKWKEHEHVTKALHKQLIDAVDPSYIAHLEGPTVDSTRSQLKISYLIYSRTMARFDQLIC